MITPTIGRRVWFWPAKSDASFVVLDPSQACDAGVIFVHGNRDVNLQVTDHAGFVHTVHHAVLHQEEDAIPGAEDAHATWMPFQQGQAKAQTHDPSAR